MTQGYLQEASSISYRQFRALAIRTTEIITQFFYQVEIIRLAYSGTQAASGNQWYDIHATYSSIVNGGPNVKE
jgi:hypothetical protein